MTERNSYRSAAAVTVLLAVSAAAGFLASRYFSVTEAPESPAVVAKTPERAPDFELPDIGGQLRSSKEWSGKPLIVNFWATWCAPCRREIPLLMELQTTYRELDLQVIGIALDIPEAVIDYAAEMDINYPLLVGEQAAVDVAEQFGVEFVALPFSVVVGPGGDILRLHIGELHREQALAIMEVLRELAAGELSDTQAAAAIDIRLGEL